MVEEGHVEVIDPSKLRRHDDEEAESSDEEKDELPPVQVVDDPREEEEKEPPRSQQQKQRLNLRLSLNEDDDQPLPSSRRTLQEVNPANRVRANSTVNAQRRNMNFDNRNERPARVFEQHNNSTQPTQRFERQADEEGEEREFDECFKIKIVQKFTQDQHERSDEEVEYLRIPSFPVARRKDDIYI